MPALCIKPRRSGRTAQLIRHVYCKEKKRSVAINLGSVRLDADPDDLPGGLRLCNPGRLSEDDIASLRTWLQLHGDPDARRLREERERRIAARVTQDLCARAREQDRFQAAVDGLATARQALALAAKDCRDRGTEPWKELRDRYLGVYRAWEAFLKSAQESGVAKTAKRQSPT